MLYREHPAESHGDDFQRTLDRALSLLDDLATPSAAAAPSRDPRPEPRKGVRFDGRPVHVPDAHLWEYRG